MDSLSTQKAKSRKIKRFVKKSRVQIIMDLFFRAIETIVVLVTIAKLCHQLVITFEDSGVAAVILANRSLAFVVVNAIVVALIANSGILLNQELNSKCKSNNLYDEFLRERSRRDGISRPDMRNREYQSGAENEVKQSITETRAKQSETEKHAQRIAENIAKQIISDQTEEQSVTDEKQSVTEEKPKQSSFEKREKHRKREKWTKQSISVDREKQSIVEYQEITVKKMEKQNLIEKKQSQSYQRSQSENLERLGKSSQGRLRRSETDASSEIIDSDDELRYKIESFIARQRRNQMDD